MNNNKGLLIVAIILALLLLIASWFAFSLNSDKQDLMTKNDALNTQITDLEDLKVNLEEDIDSLQVAYSELAEENQFLEGSVADAQAEIAKKQAAIRKLRRTAKAAEENSGGLRAQIEELLAAKADLEGAINNLQAENAALKAENEELTANLDNAKQENVALAALNKTIQEELAKLTLKNFKASAFRVEIEKKKPKATAKSRRARKISVSFDLTDVPDKYQGVRPLYMVITDDKGTPIKASSPLNTQVSVNGSPMDITAVASKEVNVGASQRLSFSHDIQERLSSGYYRVAVYTDIGLLGASSFRLR